MKQYLLLVAFLLAFQSSHAQKTPIAYTHWFDPMAQLNGKYQPSTEVVAAAALHFKNHVTTFIYLGVTKDGDERSVQFIVNRAEFFSPPGYKNDVFASFDGAKFIPVDYATNANGDKNVAYLKEPFKFIASLRKAHHLTLRAMYLNNGYKDSEFNVAGYNF